MCLAIASPVGITIPESALRAGFEANDDGAGFAYAENDQLHIEKGFMTFDEFYSAYKPHEEKASIVHFRITTHGETDEANTHPFQVGKHLAFIHNGIINAVERPDKTKSDTFWFNQKLLVPIYKRDSRFIFKDHFKDLIKEYIGWSKLVFLNNKGHYTIVNEDKGKWDEGVWYSNDSYKERKVITHHPKRITPAVDAELFTQGSRVEVKYDHNKSLNGFGTVEYFTGGQMVAVKMDGTNHPRLVHMSFVHLVQKESKFKKDDWVVRKDGNMADNVGEVQGTVGDSVVVKWLQPHGMFGGPDHVISQDKLEFWWDTSMEGAN